jgi:glutamyl-tRNA reductase
VSVVVIGVNHRTAPLSLLEKFAVDGERRAKYLDALLAADHVSEAVILSTCHRTEIWVVAEKFHGAFGDVRDVLCDLTYLPPEAFADHLSAEYDTDAVRHLFEVAAGLESVVVGEHEILGQVADAWESARLAGATGPTLNLLFRHAVEVGKRARTETAIARSVTSVSHAAVVMASEQLGSLAGAEVSVLGAGAMGRGMVDLLSDHGVAGITVVNRSRDRAEELASETDNGRAVGLDELDAELRTTDVLFTSTGSAEPIIGVADVAPALAARDGQVREGRRRDLLIVDIAVPRDVEPAVGALDGVTLLDMEALQAFADRGLLERQREVPAVRTIVEDELDRYETVRSSREVAPLVTDLHQWAEAMRTAELDRHRSRLADLDPATRDAVESLTRGLVAKLLHTPTVTVKDASGTPRGERLASSLRDLFDL